MTLIFTGAEYSTEELLREVKKAVGRERISHYSQYISLVDDILEDKVDMGFFDKEEDITQIKENLLSRWNEVREEIMAERNR